MRRRCLYLCFCFLSLATLVAGFATTTEAQDSEAGTPPAPTPRVETAPDDWDAIRQSAERYVAAFNARDAATVASLYAENAELVDSGGNVFEGRGAIEKEYAAFFESHPGATLRVIVDRVRSIAPTIVVEDGRAETRLGGDKPVVFSRYTALHAKEGDTWRLLSVRDSEDETNDPGFELEQLAWLIGEWVDEDAGSLLEIDCYWHESGAYLIRDFKVRVKGLLAAGGTERIGWDPLRKQVRSWLFDSAGGYLEGIWLRDGDKWTVTAEGFRADGQPSRATYVVTPLKKDAYHMASFNRFAGKARLEDLDMTVVRKPPASTRIEEEATEPSSENANPDQ